MDKHKDDVQKLVNPIKNPNVKNSIILKPGGYGVWGGVIIRSLIRLDGNKLMRKSRRRSHPSSFSAKKKKRIYIYIYIYIWKRSEKRINDKFVTKKNEKSIVVVQVFHGMIFSLHNAGLEAAAAVTTSPLTFSYLLVPNSSLMNMTPRRSTASQSSLSLPIQIIRFSPLYHNAPPILQTARQFSFEAAMRQT